MKGLVAVECRQTKKKKFVKHRSSLEQFQNDVAQSFGLRGTFSLTLGNQTSVMTEETFNAMQADATVVLNVHFDSDRKCTQNRSTEGISLEFVDGGENITVPAQRLEGKKLRGQGSNDALVIDVGRSCYSWSRWFTGKGSRYFAKLASLEASIDSKLLGWFDTCVRPVVTQKACFAFAVRTSTRKRPRQSSKEEALVPSSSLDPTSVCFAVPTMDGDKLKFDCFVATHSPRDVFEALADEKFVKPFIEGKIRMVLDLDETLIHSVTPAELKNQKVDRRVGDCNVARTTDCYFTDAERDYTDEKKFDIEGGSASGLLCIHKCKGTGQPVLVRMRPELIGTLKELVKMCEITFVSTGHSAYVKDIVEHLNQRLGICMKWISTRDTVNVEAVIGTKDLRRVYSYIETPWAAWKGDPNPLVFTKGLIVADDNLEAWVGPNLDNSFLKVAKFRGNPADRWLPCFLDRVKKCSGLI